VPLIAVPGKNVISMALVTAQVTSSKGKKKVRIHMRGRINNQQVIKEF